MTKKRADMNFGLRGWLVVFYCFLTFFIVTCSKDVLLNMAASSLAEKFGWNYTTMISLNTVFGWVTVAFVLLGGQAMRKISPKKIAIILGLVYAGVMLWLPQITQFWMYVVVLALITIINIIWPQQMNNTITANWFPQKRGMVMGLTTIGLPLGSGLGPKIYATLMYQKGLSFASIYLIFAIVVGVTVALGLLFVKDYPEQCGCFPDNDKEMSSEKAKQMLEEGRKRAELTIWDAKTMLTTRETWFVALSCGILQLFSNGFMGQMIPRLLAAGYERSEATNMMMIAALAACAGSFLIGWLDQLVGPKKGTLVTHAMAVIACILNIIPNTTCVLISIGFIGLTLGGSANFMVSLVSKMWGRYSFVRAFPIIHAIAQTLGCCGILIVAQLSSRIGYNGAYGVICGLAVVAIILTSLIRMDAIVKKEIAAGDESRAADLEKLAELD